MAATHITIETDAGALTFDVLRGGATGGEPLIALHGFPQGAHAWDGTAQLLTQHGIEVIAIDQRGYSPLARPIGIQHYADRTLVADVLAIADALDLPSFHLVGHDWGAHLAWVLAAEHADRVRTLTTVSVPHPLAFGAAIRTDPDQSRKSQYMSDFTHVGAAEDHLLADDAAALRAIFGDLPPELSEHYVQRLQQPGALTAALSWYRAIATNPRFVANVSVPTTFIWGAHDLAIGQTAAQSCEAYVDGEFRFVTLDHEGHWIPERAPIVLADEIARRIFGSTGPGVASAAHA